MGDHEGKAPWVATAKQAALSFARVFIATVVACWVNDGAPIRDFDLESLWVWMELGVQAAAGLTFANYLGPWEKRYGLKSKSMQ